MGTVGGRKGTLASTFPCLFFTPSPSLAEQALNVPALVNVGEQFEGGVESPSLVFIISTGDKITDYVVGKAKTNKDGDVVIQDGIVVT